MKSLLQKKVLFSLLLLTQVLALSLVGYSQEDKKSEQQQIERKESESQEAELQIVEQTKVDPQTAEKKRSEKNQAEQNQKEEGRVEIDLDSQLNSDVEPEPEPKIPPALDVYMGRRIAQTMHFMGAEWLIRNEREREERCSLMLANLGVRPAMTICDMGCGNGFHTLQLAKMTGEKGRVVGVDVQPEMLGFLRERMEEQGIENVIPILGSYHNPHLPPETIDLVLLVDVYHEFSHPQQMLSAMRASLKPDGVIVLVEFRAEDKKVPIKPLHKMSKDQVNKELTANGFKLVKEFDKLPWQHMMFFGIDTEWAPGEKREVDAPAETTGTNEGG